MGLDIEFVGELSLNREVESYDSYCKRMHKEALEDTLSKLLENVVGIKEPTKDYGDERNTLVQLVTINKIVKYLTRNV